MKQGLRASRLTLCDSKLTHAPTSKFGRVSERTSSKVSRSDVIMIGPLLMIHQHIAVETQFQRLY